MGTVRVGILGVTAIALFLIMHNSLAIGRHVKKSRIAQHYNNCSLNGNSSYNTTDSEIECALECLQRVDDGGTCAGYQWDAETLHCSLHHAPEDVLGHTGGNVTAVCMTISDCSVILEVDPTSQSGVYYIQLGEEVQKVWCDMDTDGGGWTVFLKRKDGSVDFNRNLAAYEQGFGDVSGEYWLGLAALHTLTGSETYELRADISDWEGASAYSLHSSISVAGERDNYTLQLGSFLSGNGGDWSEHSGMPFTTTDVDGDHGVIGNCAELHKGGFWYRNCGVIFPTAKYYNGGYYTSGDRDGLHWETWSAHSGTNYSMKSVEMKIRIKPIPLDDEDNQE